MLLVGPFTHAQLLHEDLHLSLRTQRGGRQQRGGQGEQGDRVGVTEGGLTVGGEHATQGEYRWR